MQVTAPSVTRTFDYVWDRLLARIDGLGDDEYFWEPVAGCWSLRQMSDGRWLLDGDGGGGLAPDPVPVTTIVWRLGHLGGTLGGFARMRFGDRQRLSNTELRVPQPGATEQDLRRVIRDAGFRPVERDATYSTMYLS